MITNYLESVDRQFRYYKHLGESTFEQLDPDALFWAPTSESNSIAIIVNHLVGNMLSRWTDFLTTDGEKEWRNRDLEFSNLYGDKSQMIEAWEKGWDCLFQALASIDEKEYNRIIYIRNMGHTITEAINRQLAHYSYHIGQIVYIGRMHKGAQWKSLSIPKGDSESYNAEKFAKPKHIEHFTNEFIKDGSDEKERDLS